MSSETHISRKWRILALVVGLGALLAIGYAFDLHQRITVAALRDAVDGAGVWGVLAFLAAFPITAVMGLPPVIFVLAALVSYGLGSGLAIAFVGSLLAATATFIAVRLTAGETQGEGPDNRLFKRIIGTLDRCPVATVAVLRAAFMLSLPVSVALALTRLRYREYLAGTAVGLVVPLAFYAITLDCWVDV